MTAMSVKQLESAILALPPDERQELLDWVDGHRRELLVPPAGESEAVKQELRSRRQEYFDHPERFIRFESDEDLHRFFEGIQNEVTARVSSARRR